MDEFDYVLAIFYVAIAGVIIFLGITLYDHYPASAPVTVKVLDHVYKNYITYCTFDINGTRQDAKCINSVGDNITVTKTYGGTYFTEKNWWEQ